MMMKKKISHILNILLHFQNRAIIRKRTYGNDSYLIRLWKIARRRGFIELSTNTSQKNVINYITSKNMRKTLTPARLNESSTLNQQDKLNPSDMEELLSLFPINWQQYKKLFSPSTSTSLLKLHIMTTFLGNLISKQAKGRDSGPEEQESWGGPEAYKLLVFLKEDFDVVIKKYPHIIVFFYAYWCPHCLRLKKPYGNAALLANEAKLPMVFGAFDVTINPEIADEKGVIGIPVIKYYKNGKYVTTYKGKRTAEDFFEFVKNPPVVPPGDEKRADV